MSFEPSPTELRIAVLVRRVLRFIVALLEEQYNIGKRKD